MITRQKRGIERYDGGGRMQEAELVQNTLWRVGHQDEFRKQGSATANFS
jgi:hypothetical protein